jgi:transcriptional regulator with XRE-family HTH domain
MEHKELGDWLRHQREAHCWSRPEMARQLIRAARTADDRSMTDVDNLCRNIYRWERGTVSPGERYKLYYCRALGISPAAFGGSDSTRTGTLALPREFSGEQVRLLNLLDIGRGASLRAESTSVAVRVARELSDGMTQAERIATHEFLTDIAQAVRWPRFSA